MTTRDLLSNVLNSNNATNEHNKIIINWLVSLISLREYLQHFLFLSLKHILRSLVLNFNSYQQTIEKWREYV